MYSRTLLHICRVDEMPHYLHDALFWPTSDTKCTHPLPHTTPTSKPSTTASTPSTTTSEPFCGRLLGGWRDSPRTSSTSPARKNTSPAFAPVRPLLGRWSPVRSTPSENDTRTRESSYTPTSTTHR